MDRTENETNLDKFRIQLYRFCCICNSITVLLCLDVGLYVAYVSHASTSKWPRRGRREELTDLGPIGEVCRLLVVQLNSLGVKLDSLQPVMGCEGFVAVVLERYGLIRC
jgi:hypothetical protein